MGLRPVLSLVIPLCNPWRFSSDTFLEPDQELDFSVAGASLAPVVQLVGESDFGTYIDTQCLDTFLISVQTLLELFDFNKRDDSAWLDPCWRLWHNLS